MTTANFSGSAPSPRPARGTSRRPVRAVAVIAALAGALALTACSSDDDGADGGPSATPGTTAGVGTGGGDGGSASPSASPSASRELEGSWLATTDGKAVALVVDGRRAALFATGGTVCSGTAGEEAGLRMIRLDCATGAKDRTTGRVDSVDADSLRITWEGGAGEEAYTKAEDGQWPSWLPTAGPG
ncbi:hypothetical protein ACH4F6_36560 [Streptomyces sp. NPDC017936]|uniref:hypothetical protein n=1 Tax=Streptomyces sp. NPDC017936 TaxID=3365016 RepID=UPI00378BA317